MILIRLHTHFCECIFARREHPVYDGCSFRICIEETKQKKLVINVVWFREFTLRDGRKKRIKIEEWLTYSPG